VVFSWEVGLEALWREVVVRPLVMTERLSLPAPEFAPSGAHGRDAISTAFGRSDEPHLSSAIPPFCLVAAHALSRVADLPALGRVPGRRWLVPVAALGVWIFLLGSDRSLSPERRGSTPLAAVNGAIELREDDGWRILDPKTRMLRRWTEPDDIILDLSTSRPLDLSTSRPHPFSMC
jgi:hypothetical protein